MTSNLTTSRLDLGNPQKLVIGLVSDTHTTQNRPDLPPGLLPSLRNVSPDLIFHAGDISIHRTLDDLAQIAPVTAVQGNRDITTSPHLPEAIEIDVCGRRIYLTHGHAPFFHYLIDKLDYIRMGYRFPRYYEHFNQYAARADLVIFGHTHIPSHTQVGKQIFVNPGAACIPNLHDPFPCFAILTIQMDAGFSIHFKYI
jgi:uncharacterized protein